MIQSNSKSILINMMGFVMHDKHAIVPIVQPSSYCSKVCALRKNPSTLMRSIQTLIMHRHGNGRNKYKELNETNESFWKCWKLFAIERAFPNWYILSQNYVHVVFFKIGYLECCVSVHLAVFSSFCLPGASKMHYITV